MIAKSLQYKDEQNRIVHRLETILDLEHRPIYTLYELDENIDIQDEIMNLAPDIKRYFNCNNLKAVTEKGRIKRPWLSIIKTLLKNHYQIITEDVNVKVENRYIHSKRYTFIYLCV